MAVAMLYPNPQPGRRNDLLKDSTGPSIDFDKAYLSQARTVLRDARELADALCAVVAGQRYGTPAKWACR